MNGIPQVGHEGHTTCCCLPWSYIGALFSGRGSMKMLPWTPVSVRNGRLWNVTRN